MLHQYFSDGKVLKSIYTNILELSVELDVYGDHVRIMIWWERLLLHSPHTCGRCQGGGGRVSDGWSAYTILVYFH